MSLPKLTEVEYEEMKIDFYEMCEKLVWFISVSGDFFDNMYGNIYENCEYVLEEEDDE